MSAIYSAVLAVHIVFGVLGLAAFWLPAVVRKGGAAHVRIGRIFYRSTSAVAVTGLTLAALLLLDPLGVRPDSAGLTPEQAARAAARARQFVPFLAYLVLITFAPVYHGVRVLETRREPGRLRTRFHTSIGVAAIAGSVAMLALGVLWRRPVFVALSPIGMLVGRGQLRFARQPYGSPMSWWYEHMGSMMGGGIAFHTAFLVLGAARFTGVLFSGPFGWIPWVVPTLVGLPVSFVWVRYYQRKFGDLDRVREAA